MITLSPSRLELWDRCRKAAMFSLDWQPNRVTPLGAVYQALGEFMAESGPKGTGELTGLPWYADYAHVRTRIMELAGTRGVQTDRQDPYDQMVHHAYLAEVLARACRQPSQEAIGGHPHVKLGDVTWIPESYLIDGGTKLMRIVLADHWDDDRQLSELHSWRTVGDVCATGLPMQLRVLVIGSVKNGRRHGHWTKARQHPYDKSLRFQKRTAPQDQFTGTWQTVWREHSKVDADHWVEQMARDNVLREVAFTRTVRVPDGRQRDLVLEDIAGIGDEIARAHQTGELFPMTRSSCDIAGPGRGPCLYQQTCYSPIDITPGETGLFNKRDAVQGK